MKDSKPETIKDWHLPSGAWIGVAPSEFQTVVSHLGPGHERQDMVGNINSVTLHSDDDKPVCFTITRPNGITHYYVEKEYLI